MVLEIGYLCWNRRLCARNISAGGRRSIPLPGAEFLAQHESHFKGRWGMGIKEPLRVLYLYSIFVKLSVT
jgi:hypothetical protein